MRTSATTSFPGCGRARSASPGSDVRALRVSYVGELGWELHPPIAGPARAVRGVVGARPRVRHRELRALCGQQHAHREGLQGLVDASSPTSSTCSRRTCRASSPSNKDDFIGKAATLAQAPAPFQDRLCRSRRRPIPMRAAASPCSRRGPLHRRDHLRRLRPSGQEKPRVRLRRSRIRRAREHVSTCSSKASGARATRAGRRGFRSRQCADEGLKHGNRSSQRAPEWSSSAAASSAARSPIT